MLEEIGEALEMAVSKPAKSSGTRWLDHKIQAMNWVSKHYGFLMVHLRHLIEDESFTREKGQNLRKFTRHQKSTSFK